MDYYDYVKLNSNSNVYFNNSNTKLKYSVIPKGFTETTIYETFIFYCLKRKTIDEELDVICKINRDDGLKTIEELKSSGVNYTTDDFVNLLQHIFEKNIIRKKIEIVEPLPEFKVTELSTFTNLYLPLLSLSKRMYSNHRKETDKLRNYILEYSDSVKKSLLKFLQNDLSYTKQIIDELSKFLDSITVWDVVNGSMTITSTDLTQCTNNTFLKNSIVNLSSTYLNIVINKIDYSNIDIRKNLKLSERHIATIKTFVYDEFQPLEKFFDNQSLNEILIGMNSFDEIREVLSNKILLEINQSDGFEPVLGKDTMTEIYEFLFYLTVNIYLSKASELQHLEDKKNLGDFLFTCISLTMKNKNTLNMTQDEMYNKLLKSKELEKSEITTYLRDISDELREIENMQKNLKLGKWSKGQTKGLVTYMADTYDGEMLQHDIRETINVGEIDISTSESQQEDFVESEISGEVNDLGFIADDDDYGDRDGDEGF